MDLQSKVADRIELEDEIFSEDAASEGLRIEEILHRAHQIHRARGGLIGYDLEDWQRAERERMGEISQPISESKERISEPRSLEIHTSSSKGWKTGEPS
jgi:hypothetical protein